MLGSSNSSSHDNDVLSFPELAKQYGISPTDDMMQQLQHAGLLDTSLLFFLARDFVSRPEALATLLIQDFGVDPLVAHQVRAIVMAEFRRETNSRQTSLETAALFPSVPSEQSLHPNGGDVPTAIPLSGTNLTKTDTLPSSSSLLSNALTVSNHNNKTSMKRVVVNEKSRRRRQQAADQYEYSLSSSPSHATLYPQLLSEMDDFYQFMTHPSIEAQEDVLRPATAQVYLRHAKLFLGWYIQQQQHSSNGSTSTTTNEETPRQQQLSIFDIIPNKNKESASTVIDFVQWLRSRSISVSYEANMLRGIIKFLKFRFAQESETDSSYGGNTFDDIPLIKEVRKLHRSANQKTKVSPRSSDEQMKWISWPEYLHVIEQTKAELLQMMIDYKAMDVSELTYRKKDTENKYSLQQERVAAAYQNYLILAIFANIPDRQRTVREIEIGRTLIKDHSSGCWTVKHGPDDYKTGKAYGERPAMQLNAVLTPAMDDFIDTWRPALRPKTMFLFVQSKTGLPLTGDGIYRRVSQSCFKYTGKRTNPHLLRDMIVTHVRESSQASEKDLEALALYMGHSLQMQRSSYDRRTLTKKIEPAVKLMQEVNANGVNGALRE